MNGEDRPLTYAEQVSELLFAGKTLAEIARYTPWTRAAMFLPRDKYGRLKRKDTSLPDHVGVDENGFRKITGKTVTLNTAFKRAYRALGLSKVEIDAAWQKFKDDNPDMGRGGARGKSRKRKRAGY